MPYDQETLERMLSAYLDGELTQEEHQRVRVWLEDSAEAREHLRELEKLKELTGAIAFAQPPDERLDELEQRLSVQAPRNLGWTFLIVGLSLSAFALLGAAYYFLIDPEVPLLVKGVGGALGGGLALLAGSVVRQRWLEWPHDRYRGVKR